MTKEDLRNEVIEAIHTVYDPEIPVNIWDLGLVYEVKVNDDFEVLVKMTLTAPSCPSAQDIPVEVDQRIREIPEVNDCNVTVVWNPPWDKSMMSEEAMIELGFF